MRRTRISTHTIIRGISIAIIVIFSIRRIIEISTITETLYSYSSPHASLSTQKVTPIPDRPPIIITPKNNDNKQPSHIFETFHDVYQQPPSPKAIPFFFVIPKTGSSTVKAILNKCLNLRMASSTSAIDYTSEKELRIITPTETDHGGQYASVNFGYLEGIQRAQDWNMASSGLVDVAITSYIHEASHVFTSSNPARMFTIFRNPVQRMISDYNYQKIANWERTHTDESSHITLLEYATNPKYHVDNWMTRMIANVHNGPVTDSDFHYAKKIIQEKCWVLLLDKMEESVNRLITFMNWEDHLDPNPPTTENSESENGNGGDGGGGGNQCLRHFIYDNPSNANPHPNVDPHSKEWEQLKEINRYDLNLYWFAVSLFDGEQKQIYESLQRMHRQHTEKRDRQHEAQPMESNPVTEYYDMNKNMEVFDNFNYDIADVNVNTQNYYNYVP